MANNVLEKIIEREGGFVDHPADRGGPTKYGVTMPTLAAYRKQEVTRQDIVDLTLEEACNVYRNMYMEPFRLYQADGPLYDLLVDASVHHGVNRVVRWVTEINTLDKEVLYREVLKRRFQLIGNLITKQPSQAVFARGWMNRLMEFIR